VWLFDAEVLLGWGRREDWPEGRSVSLGEEGQTERGKLCRYRQSVSQQTDTTEVPRAARVDAHRRSEFSHSRQASCLSLNSIHHAQFLSVFFALLMSTPDLLARQHKTTEAVRAPLSGQSESQQPLFSKASAFFRTSETPSVLGRHSDEQTARRKTWCLFFLSDFPSLLSSFLPAFLLCFLCVSVHVSACIQSTQRFGQHLLLD